MPCADMSWEHFYFKSTLDQSIRIRIMDINLKKLNLFKIVAKKYILQFGNIISPAKSPKLKISEVVHSYQENQY